MGLQYLCHSSEHLCHSSEQKSRRTLSPPSFSRSIAHLRPMDQDGEVQMSGQHSDMAFEEATSPRLGQIPGVDGLSTEIRMVGSTEATSGSGECVSLATNRAQPTGSDTVALDGSRSTTVVPWSPEKHSYSHRRSYLLEQSTRCGQKRRRNRCVRRS